jgi:hypothetical protein
MRLKTTDKTLAISCQDWDLSPSDFFEVLLRILGNQWFLEPFFGLQWNSGIGAYLI